MTPKRRFFSAILVAVPVLCASCNKEPSAQPPPAGMPPLPGGAPHAPGPHAAGGAAGMPSAATGDPHAGLPAGHPSIGGQAPGGAMGTAGSMGGMPPAEVAAPFDPNQKIAGQISVADALKAQVKEGDVMFVVARTDDGSEKGGMILGVKRLVCGAFPLDFVVDGRDSMMVGSKFEGKVLLTARVDKDGDAMTKLPGDVIGVAHLSIPAVGVKLSLDTVTK